MPRIPTCSKSAKASSDPAAVNLSESQNAEQREVRRDAAAGGCADRRLPATIRPFVFNLFSDAEQGMLTTSGMGQGR
jgi:hypothetical protein